MCSDGVVAKQLARAVFVWMGTAGHLIWPSFITEKKIHCNSFAATGGLGASDLSLSVSHTDRQGTYSSCRNDRRARCFSKSTRGCFALSSLYHNLQSLKPTLFFQKFQNKFFKGFFPPLNSPITETVFFA